jgi:hypothetical protein
MKRLLIHIGTGKTGTSTIQNFLFSNRKQLAKEFSLLYPEQGLSQLKHFGEDIYAHYPIVSWVHNRETGKLANLARSINKSNCQTAIISCENFYHQLFAQEIIFLASVLKEFSITIICYVRRQDLYMESAWKQQIKTGAMKMPFSVFLERHTQTKYLNEVHANYYRMLKPWADIFGVDAIKIKVFDKSEWIREDLIADFLNTCGLDEQQALPPLIKPSLTNTSLPTELITTVQKVNAMGLIPKKQQKSFVLYLTKFSSFSNPPLLSTENRFAIMKNYQKTNQQLFKELGKRAIPECFRLNSIQNTTQQDTNPSIILDETAIKALVDNWKQSTFPIGEAIKSYLKKPLKLILDKKNNANSINRKLDTNKTLQPSPFVMPIDRPNTTLEDYDVFFAYGFNSLPTLKATPQSSLPRCVMTVNHCFISAAVFRPLEKPQTLLGALYDNGQLIESANYRGATAKPASDPLTISQPRINKALAVQGSCVYLGWLSNFFGHLLLEAPARFWFLNSIDVKKSRFIFHPLGDNANLKAIFAIELAQVLFSSFGIRKEQIIVADRDLYVEELIIPSSLFFLSLTVDPSQFSIYQQIKHYLLQNQPTNSTPKKKIYLSRRLLKKSNARKASNEEAIEQLFKKYGFEIIFPEQLPLHQQITLLSGAEIIAGCEGSALHLGIFMPLSSKMIILSARSIAMNQLLINTLGNVETHFINAGIDKSVLHFRGIWDADISFIKEQLNKIMNPSDFIS